MGATTTRIAGDRTYEYKDGVWYLIEEEDTVGQGDAHAMLAIALFDMLQELLWDHPLARVFFDIFLHWDKTDGDLCVAPDLVVFPQIDDPARGRSALYLWEEASRPVFVLEVLSTSSRDTDPDEKLRVYQDDLGVPEYFICDPMDGAQQVWGHRLEVGEYREIEPDEQGRVWSEELRAWFGPDELGDMQVWDASGRRMSRHVAAVREREAERQRAEAAEARTRELEAALRRMQDAGNDEPKA